MLKIVYGKSRSGKTTYIYNLIKEKYKVNIENNIKSYLIVPEQFSLTTEEKLVNYLQAGGLFNIEVLTLKRMAYYVFNELGLKIDNISDVGKKIIIYNILNNGEFKIFNSSDKGNIDNILDIFSEFSRYGVDSQALSNLSFEDNRLKDKITDLTNIYSKYIQMVEAKGKNYANELEILLQYIDSSTMLNNCDIYIDEFYGFTKQEYEIIMKLVQKNNVTITFCIDDVALSDNTLDIYNQNKAEYIKFLNLCRENNVSYEVLKVDNNEIYKESDIVHLQENIFAYPYKKYGKQSNNIQIYSCTNVYTEIENLAIEIAKKVKQGYRYSDIVVITRDLEKYSDVIWAIFKKYDIPYFLDCKTDISNNQISVLIYSLLDIVIENLSYQSVFAYLKTGFLDVDIDDVHQLENYAIKWGIYGYKWNGQLKYSNSEEEKQRLEFFNTMANKYIKPLIELRNKCQKCKCAKDIVIAIYSFLSDNGIEKAIQDKILNFKNEGLTDLEREYTDIWNYYIDVFEQLVLSIGDEQIDNVEFKKLLEIGVTNTQKAYVPLYKDCVIIGDIERTRTNTVKALYFIGTQNDKFPVTYPTEGLLTDNDRIYLKENNVQLAKNSNEKIMLDEFNIYKAITMTANSVSFSYVFNDLNGVSFRPSFLINKVKGIFDITETVVDEQYVYDSDVYVPDVSFDKMFDENLELIKWYKDNNKKLYTKYMEICNFDNSMELKLDDENIQKLYGDELKTSISRIEEYVKCPYSFYLKYILKVKEKELYTIRNLDIGNFNHQILEEFFKYLIDNDIDIKNMTLEKCNEISERIIEDMLTQINIEMIKQAKEYAVLKIKLKRILKKAIWVLVLQIKNSSFKPVGTEVEFGEKGEYHEIQVELENGKVVKLRGKIDRIDIANTNDGRYVRIIDYKSSNKSIDISDIYNGLNIQLITYLDAVTQKEEGIIPGGIFYFKVDDPILKSNTELSKEEIENKIIDQMKLQGLILKDKTLVNHMDNTIVESSNLVNVKLDKQGEVKGKNAITIDEFKTLQKQAQNVLKKISTQIFEGKIPVLPYWKNKNMYGCQYCSYNSICKFNSKDSKCKYNIIRSI